MNIHKLRKIAGREEVDYQLLLSALEGYTNPRDKVSRWLKSGELIRVKKGLYVFGEEAAQAPYSLELLANLIYGPSAISLSYALYYYGLIPERVTTITSITNKRNKSFSTPVGDFTYRYLAPDKYTCGIELVKTHGEGTFFIASPEKALSDHIHLIDKTIKLATHTEIENYLIHDMRIDETKLVKLRIGILDELASHYSDPRLAMLSQFIAERKKHA